MTELVDFVCACLRDEPDAAAIIAQVEARYAVTLPQPLRREIRYFTRHGVADEMKREEDRFTSLLFDLAGLTGIRAPVLGLDPSQGE